MKRIQLGLLLTWALAAASCGSGVVGGILAGNRGGGSGGTQPPSPQTSLVTASIPLVDDWLPPLASLIGLQVNNLVVPSDGRTLVSFENLDIGLDRARARVAPTLVNVDRGTNSSRLSAFLDINLVRGLLSSNFFAKDHILQVRVEVDGDAIAAPSQLTLVRPGLLTRKLGDVLDGAMIVEVDGFSRFLFEASGLRVATSSASSVELGVLQRNYAVPRLVNNQANPEAQRLVTAQGRTYSRDAGTGVSRISGVAPPATYPGVAKVRLRGPVSGVCVEPSAISGLDLPTLLYVPTLRSFGPASVPVVGGSQGRLTGRGLLPAHNEGKLELLFGDVEIEIEKGESRWAVDANAIIRDRSSEQVLVFLMPHAPDGLPGTASVLLRQRLSSGPGLEFFVVERRLPASNGVRFARAAPTIGPFVELLGSSVRGLAVGKYRPETPWGSDFAILTQSTGSPRLRLGRSQGFAVFAEIGDSLSVNVADPIALVPGDFDQASEDDVFVVDRGSSSNDAAHVIGLSETSDNSIVSPFRESSGSAVRFRTERETETAVAADVDGDSIDDLVVLRADPARAPLQVWTKVNAKVPVVTSFGRGDAVPKAGLHAKDLDGDGDVDLAYANDATPPLVFVWRGNGRGGFTGPETYDFGGSLTVEPGVTPQVHSVAVDTTSKARHLVVTSAVRNSSAVDPLVVLLPYDSRTGTWSLAGRQQLSISGDDVFGASLCIDVDDDGIEEVLAVATSLSPAKMRAFGFAGARLSRVDSLVAAADPLVSVTSMREANAQFVDVSGRRQTAKTLVVAHRQAVNSVPTPALSTFPVLAGKIASRFPGLGLAKAPLAHAVGDFDADGRTVDVASAIDGKVVIHLAAAPGVFTKTVELDLPRIIPSTLHVCPRIGGPILCWIESSGQIASYDSKSKAIHRSSDLRRFLPVSQRLSALADLSRLTSIDVAGTGEGSLVALIGSAGASSNAEAQLLFLPAGDRSRFGFAEPIANLAIPALTSSPRAGRILTRSTNDPGFEIAYTTPTKVEFAAVQLAGTKVAMIALARLTVDLRTPVQSPILLDFDEDGRDDFAVLTPATSRCRTFFNRVVHSGQGNSSGGFISLGGATLSYAGIALGLEAADMNGDGLEDLCVVSSLRRGQTEEPFVCFFPNQDRGAFGACYNYPSFFFASELPSSFALGDLDGNGLSDVILGKRVLLSR